MPAKRGSRTLDEEVERLGGADPSRLGGRARGARRAVRKEEAASRRKAKTGKGAAARRRVLKGRTG